jgi:hypothetical protein
MPKVNFSLEVEVRNELVRLVPERQRSRVVNALLRDGLRRMKQGDAMQRLLRLRGRSAKLRGVDITGVLRRERTRR